MEAARLRVIADDLTGACDVAAALAPWPNGVAVDDLDAHGPMRDPSSGLVVYNTQSRTLAPALAARRVYGALARVPRGSVDVVLKKIDTALRGALGAELDAAMDAVGARVALVAPAIPEVGRTTRDGRQWIDGAPLDTTAFRQDPQNPVGDARIGAVLEATGRRRTAVLPADVARNGRGAETVGRAVAAGTPVIVCDAQSADDLAAWIRVAIAQTGDGPVVLAGSTGLAAALRRSYPGLTTPVDCPVAPATGRGVLVVAGSAHPTTRGQLAAAAGCGMTIIPVDLAAPEGAASLAVEVLGGDGVAILRPPDGRLDGGSDVVLKGLQGAVYAVLRRARPEGFVLIGGETAHRVLSVLGHPRLWVEEAPFPLVVRCRILDGALAGTLVLTKGGSSGPTGRVIDVVAEVVRR